MDEDNFCKDTDDYRNIIIKNPIEIKTPHLPCADHLKSLVNRDYYIYKLVTLDVENDAKISKENCKSLRKLQT